MTVPVIRATAPAGPRGAPLIVLGPSLGTSTILWDAAAALLQSRFRTLSWELPGHGFGPAATEAFTVAELAEGVVRILDELGETRVLYAGVSLGGAVGLELLLAHPDRVDAAAIICSGAVIGTPAGWLERAAMVRATGTASVVVASAQRWFAPESMHRSPEITGRLLHSLRDTDDESYALCCDALAGYDVRSALGGITTSVLAIWGEHDQVAPERSSSELAAGIPDARIARVADAGHLAPAERPAETAELLRAFFTGGSMNDDERRSAGMTERRAVLGDAHVDRAIAGTTPTTEDFQDLITRYAWGEIWGRPGLARRDRSIAVLSSLIALGAWDEIPMHLRAAQRNGLSREEIVEVILQSAIYAGVPAANHAFAIAAEVLDHDQARGEKE